MYVNKLFIGFTLIWVSCQELPPQNSKDPVVISKPENDPDSSKNSVNPIDSDLTGIIIFNNRDAELSFGYKVNWEGKKIYQKTIPGLPGKSGFKTYKSALNTALLVREKMRSGIFPPAVSPQEIDSILSIP